MVTATPSEIKEILASGQAVRLVGTGSHEGFRLPAAESSVEIKVAHGGLVSHEAEDQVVVCRANTSMAELQTELLKRGQCLPYLPILSTAIEQTKGTVAGHLSMNLPHSYESACGSWKDWLLGAKVLLADGREAKSGSKAVKSVAGYDVHSFLIGSRGALVVLLELTFKTFPVGALPKPDLQSISDSWPEKGWIQRTLPSDFQEAEPGVFATHPELATSYRSTELDELKSGWTIGWGLGHKNLAPFGGTEGHYFRRAKMIFDPQNLLNPGEFGS